MIATSNQSSQSPATVRLIPSTAIEPEDYLTTFSVYCQRTDAGGGLSSLATWHAESDAYFTDQAGPNFSEPRWISLGSSYEAEPLMLALMLGAYGVRPAEDQLESHRRKSQILLHNKSEEALS